MDDKMKKSVKDRISEIELALDLWHDTKKKYYEFGIGDSEPEMQFQKVIKRMVKNEPINFEAMDNGDWDIYMSMPGSKAVCRALSARSRMIGRRVASIVKKAPQNQQEELILWLKEWAWRCNWDITPNF